MERIAAHDDERECDARGCRQRGDRRAKNSMTGSYDLCDRRYPILWLLHEFTIIIQTLFYRIAAIMVLSTSRTSQKGLIVIGIVALFSIPRLFVTINVLRSILFFVQSPETFNTDIATMLIEDPLPALLRDAGLENSTLASKLPSWKDLSAIYGSDESVILVGADTCESFRDAVPQYDRYLAVGGMYNSGTSLLAKYFQENCQIMGAKGTFLGMLWQVRGNDCLVHTTDSVLCLIIHFLCECRYPGENTRFLNISLKLQRRATRYTTRLLPCLL